MLKTKKIIILLIISLAITLFVPRNVLAQSESTTQPDYDYLYLWQDRTLVNMKQGDVTSFQVQLKNTGNNAWYNSGKNPVRLGSGSSYGNPSQQHDYINEFDKNVEFSHWVSDNRISLSARQDDGIVAPGDWGQFVVDIKVPDNMTPGIHRIYFTPVVDGVTWMKDVGIYWEINVIDQHGGFDYEYISQDQLNVDNTLSYYGYPDVSKESARPGQIRAFRLEIKNTGTNTWARVYSDPNNLRLGVGSVYGGADNQKDSPSILFPGLTYQTPYGAYSMAPWISNNRIEVDSNVPPGKIALISFYVKAPSQPGKYRLYLTPVLDGVQWLRDEGIYFELSVE